MPDLPSPFYRVALKLIILDASRRLLVVKNRDGMWEIPGGGWEHDEPLAACAARELHEELGIQTAVELDDIAFTYRARSKHGHINLRLVVPARIGNHDFQPSEMVDKRFVTKEELVALPMESDEAPIKQLTANIWPS